MKILSVIFLGIINVLKIVLTWSAIALLLILNGICYAISLLAMGWLKFHLCWIENKDVVLKKCGANKMKIQKSKSSGVVTLSSITVPEDWDIKETDSVEKKTGEIKNLLLKCDFNRFGFHEYEPSFLEDLRHGHWDLWDNDTEIGTTLDIPEKFVAKDPARDILENCVVGIDFGTKSTVVVRLDDGKLKPVRIGLGDLFKVSEAKHYENPTCMEFRNLRKFLEMYNRRKGRPETRWEWLTISHSAVDSLLASDSKDYSAYLDELKQWAGGEDDYIPFKDKTGDDFSLHPFDSLSDSDDEFNPIEIYAYLLGLNINNMIRKICMKYILSYPVTYTLETRERLKKSFENGLKQSLPSALLKNSEVMKQFSIEFGASEPAAYAVCALQEYGFDPEENEAIRYGVFDFGGGTTDFDFGIWRGANRQVSSERGYAYVIEHCNASGDPRLGGENILSTLAFETFKLNRDVLRELHISFEKVHGCDLPSADAEIMLDNDGNARKNMKAMREELRPLWEQREGYESKYESGMLKVDLWDRNGSLKSGVDFQVDKEQLENIIVKLIDDGVKQFFQELKNAFANESFGKANGKIEIFLAGNSSKSGRVKEIFNQHIAEFMKDYLRSLPESERPEGGMESLFELLPPLGTEEANKIQRERGVKIEAEDVERPTGKTGVAFGLLLARDSDNVKVINKDQNSFLYYVGEKKKKYFNYILRPGCDYGVWMPLEKAADTADIEIYYTRLSDAEEGHMPIGEATFKRVSNPLKKPDEEKSVFIRAVDPKTIELVVGDEDDGKMDGEPLTPVVTIRINE